MLDLIGRALTLAATLWVFGIIALVLYPIIIDRPLRAFLRGLKK